MNHYSIIKADLKRQREKIIALLKNDGRGMTAANFEWKYEKYPYGTPNCWLIKANISSRIVGMGSLFQRVLAIDNELVKVGTLADLIVQKGHRTLFPALELERCIKTQSLSLGYKFVYSYSTGITANVFKRVGYQKIGTYHQLVKPIKSAKITDKFLPKILKYIRIDKLIDLYFNLNPHEKRVELGERYFTAVLDSFDYQFDILFDKLKHNYQIIGDRRKEFLNWRYTQDPNHKYQVFCLFEKEQGLVGYIIYFENDHSYYIDDICTIDDKNMLERILSEYVRMAKKSNIEIIQLRYMGDNITLNSLKKFRFMEIDTDREIMLLANNRNMNVEMYDNSNWHFFTGDKNV